MLELGLNAVWNANKETNAMNSAIRQQQQNTRNYINLNDELATKERGSIIDNLRQQTGANYNLDADGFVDSNNEYNQFTSNIGYDIDSRFNQLRADSSNFEQALSWGATTEQEGQMIAQQRQAENDARNANSSKIGSIVSGLNKIGNAVGLGAIEKGLNSLGLKTTALSSLQNLIHSGVGAVGGLAIGGASLGDAKQYFKDNEKTLYNNLLDTGITAGVTYATGGLLTSLGTTLGNVMGSNMANWAGQLGLKEIGGALITDTSTLIGTNLTSSMIGGAIGQATGYGLNGAIGQGLISGTEALGKGVANLGTYTKHKIYDMGNSYY